MIAIHCMSTASERNICKRVFLQSAFHSQLCYRRTHYFPTPRLLQTIRDAENISVSPLRHVNFQLRTSHAPHFTTPFVSQFQRPLICRLVSLLFLLRGRLLVCHCPTFLVHYCLSVLCLRCFGQDLSIHQFLRSLLYIIVWQPPSTCLLQEAHEFESSCN